MLKNYLTVAIRNLWRNKTNSFINIAGLALGMAVFILIGIYVKHELSYDRFHTYANRTYRVLVDREGIPETTSTPVIPDAVGPQMAKAFPEVEAFTRLSSVGSERTIYIGEDSFIENTAIQAEQSFFDIFTVEPILGDISAALIAPGSVVLTESAAEKYFGQYEVLGEPLEITTGRETLLYQVTAVIRDFPSNSHLNVTVITYRPPPTSLAWNRYAATTYIRLAEDVTAADFEAKLPSFVEQNAVSIGFNPEGEEVSMPIPAGRITLLLQHLTDIHLRSNFTGLFTSASQLDPTLTLYVYLFIALIILLIACTNYVNMTIAMTLHRLDEVGIRKTVGARRGEIITQFLVESYIVCLAAVVVSLILVWIALPSFNGLVNVKLSLATLANFTGFVQICGFLILVGLVSGGYPAYVLSKPGPIDLLQQSPEGKSSRGWLRKGLLLFQYTASIALILITLAIVDQMRFVRASRLNVDGDAVIYIANRDQAINENYQAFKNALLVKPAVVKVTTGRLPGTVGAFVSYSDEDELPTGGGTIDVISGDIDYVEAFGLELIEGRLFQPSDIITDSRERRIEQQDAISALYSNGPPDPVELDRVMSRFATPSLVNETALRWLGIEGYPIGEYFSYLNHSRVIGVVRDFHTRTLHTAINPAVIQISSFVSSLLIRYDPERVQDGIAATREVWAQFAPNSPFDFSFLNDIMDENYQAELRMGTVLAWFTLLAILIACLGLFGLALHSTTRRTKEIGIRKVVGASITQVVTLLSKEFLVLVLIANVIAWPIAWYAMRRWLENFAYRIELGVEVFILAGLLALVIALATVSWQTVRAATANPVESLRYE